MILNTVLSSWFHSERISAIFSPREVAVSNEIGVNITHSVEHKKCQIWKRKCISFVKELCDRFKKWLIRFTISFVINLWKLCQVSWMLGKYQRNREIWCFSPHSKRTLNRVINGISKEMTLVVSLFH